MAMMLMLSACSQPSPETSSTPDNEKIVRQLYEYFNQHEWEKMANLYIDSAAFKDPAMGTGIVKQSRQAIREHYSQLHQMFPDIKDEVVQIYPSGEKHVIVEFVSKGTDPEGNAFELPICTIFTIENGKITQDFTYYDNSGAAPAEE